MKKRIRKIDGEKNLLNLLRLNGVEIESPCNGGGTCKKCKVNIGDKEVLACMTDIDSIDGEYVEVEILSESEIDFSVVLKKWCEKYNSFGIALDIGTTSIEMSLIDMDSGDEIAVASCTNPQKKYGLDVLTRIAHADTDGVEELRRVLINAINALLDSMFKEIESNIPASSFKDMESNISDSPFKDVESKMSASPFEEIENKISTSSFKDIERNTSDSTSDTYKNSINKYKSKVESMIVSSNCTMTHIFLGEDISSIGRFPFEPVFKDSKLFDAPKLGIHLENAKVQTLPQVSGFIGGDIVSGVYYILDKINPNEKILFIDIGTNGELVLIDGDRMISCSCAAGPALEGMNISCGIRAGIGAIEDIRIDKSDIYLSIIGLEKEVNSEEVCALEERLFPKGICGSGILVTLRELIANGYIGKMGRIVDPNRLDDEKTIKNRFFVSEEGSRSINLLNADGLNIGVSQSDIRQIQLAKGAIHSAVKILLRKAKIEVQDVDKVVIAGQFGLHIPEESLIETGILDRGFSGKIVYEENTSKKGAIKALFDSCAVDVMEDISARCEYFEIANEEGYEKVFTKSMMFV